MKQEWEVVELDRDGDVYDILQSGFELETLAINWIKDHESEIGGRMSDVRLTIRCIYVIT